MKLKLSLMVLFFVAALQAQNLNITSSGESSSPGTNWSISGNTLNVAASGTANINPSVIVKHLNTIGDLTINLPWQSNTARNINIINSISYTGSASRSLIINAANDIIISSGVSITSSTSTMNLVLRTTLNDGDPNWGRIQLDGATINTHGGHFWAGGGAVNTSWNGLIVGDSNARVWADDIAALSLIGSTVTTNGGAIYLAGRSHDSIDADGTNYGINIEDTSISSGAGNITINGTVNGKYTIGIATRIYASSGSTTISSTSATITITGLGEDPANGNGYRFGLLIYSPSESNMTTISSVSGAINIQGTANFASTINDKEGLVISGTPKIISQTGNIELKGSNALESSGQYCNSIRFVPLNSANAIRIGYDGTNTYSGNILIEGNSIYQRDNNSTSGSIAIQSTGNLTIQPSGNAFTYLRAGDAGTLTFDDDWNFGTTLGGFTFGKSTNTTSLTYSNSLTTNGPVTFYTGNTQLGVGAEIITNGATGTINFLSSNGFGTVADSGSTRGRIMATGGGAIHINSDYDNNNSGDLNIDWLTIDGGTGNILMETAIFNWNTGSQDALPVFYSNGGSLTIRNVTSSDYSISTNWFAMFGTFGGVTLGREGGTGSIDLSSCTVCYPTALNYGSTAFQIAGPITALGGIINANFNLRSTTSGSDILLKAAKNVIVAENVSVQTNNGDITFWSNSEGVGNSTDGDFIGIYSGVSINSANGLTNQTSGGGTITMAGGSTSQVLASGTVVPTGYAYSSRTTNWVDILPPGGVNFGEKRGAAGGLNTLNIYSGGGDIVVKGKSNSSSAGVQWFSGNAGATQVINSGNGTITIDGLATSSDAHGIEFMSYARVVYPTIISSNTSSAAIRIKGEAFSTNFRAGYQGAVKLEANGIGGGIEVNGKVASLSNYAAIEASGLRAYSVSGPITFIGNGGLGLNVSGVWGKGTLPSSSSTITLRSDKISVPALTNVTIETTGTVTLEPLGTSFASALTFPITNLTVSNTVTGLTIGKSTNTANVTIANATTIAGPITVYGGDIAVNANLNTTAGAATGDVLLKGSGNINVAASKSVTTTGGDAIFWSDSDASGEGYVQLYSGAAVTTNNGAITMGGGTDPLTQYARGVGTLGTTATLDTEFSSANDFGIAGVHFRAGVTVNSGGGAITLNGQNKESAQGILVSGVFLNKSSIDSGAGKIIINGKATGSGSNAQAITTDPGASQMVIKSSNSATDAITIMGDASAVNSTTTSLGVNFNGIVLATNGGGILITGKSGAGVGYDRAGQFTGSILSNSGPITISGENDNSNVGISLNNLKLGAAAATDITSSTSNITLSANTIVFSSTNPVNTSGLVAIEPKDASFVNALTFPITSLTLSSNVSGLTLGKSTNTANITFANATTIAGSITAYGGDIAVNENLNTSGGAANGDVLLKASGTIIQAASKKVTTAGGDVTFWSDSDGNGSGYIQLTGGATSGIFSGGGNVVFGGGLDIATGYARGAAVVDAGTFDSYISGIHLRNGSTIDSDGGGITLRGQNVGNDQAKMQFGITGYNASLLAGTGKISLTGLAGGSGGSTSANAQGISSWPILTAGQGWTIRSTNPDADAIRLIGDASPCNNSSTSLGINFHGTIESTGGGGIYMSGKASTAAVYDQPLDIYGNILANSGAITMVAENDVTTQTGLFFGVNSTIGSKAGTNVTSSTSTIVLKSDNTVFNVATPINTSGTVSIVPLDASTSFGVAQVLGSSVVLNQTVSGLTVGTPGNTANITVNDAKTIAGPISLYGGTITLDANLTTTNNGDISLYTDNALGGLTTMARTITAAGSFNYIPRSDFFSVPVTYPITNLTLVSKGLLIGKPTNTANITFANATTVTGPITAYGGTITLNADLTTTNSSNFGTISLYSDNPLGGLNTARTLNAAGAFKYIPRTTAFTADVTYPIANLTSTSAGLTIGKTTNDKNITITQDVTGPFGIELYGANVNINSNLTTTGVSAIMYLKGNTTITAGKSITSGGNFTHDGNMTFKSDASGTAAFGPLGGNFITLNGTSTVERYIPAKRAYRFLSSSVTTSTSIRQNWQENGGTATGLGTHITGVGGAANGFDATATNNASLFTFTSGAWDPVINTTTNTLSAGTAYRLMVRGDRTVSLSTNNPTATVTTLRATGVLKTGVHTPTLNQNSAGYSFVGNPYQAPVDIKAVLENNSSNMNTGVVYYWDPSLNNRGTYVTRTLGNINQNTVNSTSTSNFNQYLQPGQAVFVKKLATGVDATMIINESHKSISNGAAGVFRATTTNDYGMLRVNLKANVNNQWEVIEGALAIFHPSYSWGVTEEDANKFSNLDEEVSFMQNSTSLAIAMQSNPSVTDELPMKLNNTRYTSYQWQFELTDYNGLTPYLLDTQNNTYTQIDNATTVPFTVNGQENTRFRIVFQNNALGTPTFDNQVVLYPNPASSSTSGFYLQGITTAEVAMHNLLGQKIPVETSVNGTALHVTTKQNVSKGVYIVSITQEGTTSQVKWIVE